MSGGQLSEQVETPASELAVPNSATESRMLDNIWSYNPDLDFKKLLLEAQYGAKGFRLIENKDWLIGVPMIFIGATYRPGFPRDGAEGDYVSIEAVVADKDTLASFPIQAQLPSEMKVWANEPIVFNDGSTGIRRQMTEVFQSAGLIDVGKPRNKDENPFDRPYQKWASGAELATTGIVASTTGEKFRFVAPRGLRRSDYEWNDKPATTFYIG